MSGIRKMCLPLLVMLTVFVLNTVSIAQDKVVVIPLGGAKNYLYWQGNWSVDTSYKIGDGVQYEGSSYTCVEAHVTNYSNSPPSVYWNFLALKGETGATGTIGPQGPKGDQGDPGTSSWTDGTGQVTTMDNIGIGVETPGAELDVAGNVTVDETVDANRFIGGIDHSIEEGAEYGFIGGGETNRIWNAYSNYSGIASGKGNFIGVNCTRCDPDLAGSPCYGDYSTVQCISESSGNSSPYSFIGGGRENTVNNDYGVIAGGRLNSISRLYSFIGGGSNNRVFDDSSVIVGGRNNFINEYGEYSFIGGGYENYIRSYNPSDKNNTIGSGFYNTINNSYDAYIGGGSWNRISYGPFSTIGGGQKNMSLEKGTTIAGGRGNHITGEYCTIGGGWMNLVDGYSYYSTIIGGSGNRVYASNNSVAMGGNARVWHNNSFVWSDSTCTGTELVEANNKLGYHGSKRSGGGDVSDPFEQDCDHSLNCADVTTDTTAANQFMARARGGFVFYTASSTTTGAQLPAGSGAWSSLSDRAAKENITELDGRIVLAKISDMPISTWNYKTQDDNIRHAGPMAQDFYAAFGLGEDERHLSSVDVDGIALAAIKELKQQKDAEIAALRQTIVSLDSEIATLKETIQRLAKRFYKLEGNAGRGE